MYDTKYDRAVILVPSIYYPLPLLAGFICCVSFPFRFWFWAPVRSWVELIPNQFDIVGSAEHFGVLRKANFSPVLLSAQLSLICYGELTPEAWPVDDERFDQVICYPF
jgi:hypothetical protein